MTTAQANRLRVGIMDTSLYRTEGHDTKRMSTKCKVQRNLEDPFSVINLDR